MLALRDKLFIYLHDSLEDTYDDMSNYLADFMRDDYIFDSIKITDYILIGYNKPIAQIYIDVITPILAAEEISIVFEYYDGIEFKPIKGIIDDTRHLQRSGFVQWDRSGNVVAKTELNDSPAYWYRIKVSDECTFKLGAISLLFCDERDLATEDPNVNSTNYRRGQSNQLPALVAARDEIIQELNNKGIIVFDGNIHLRLSPWDLVDIYQVRVAAKFLTLSKIYLHLSDQEGDKWGINAEVYKALYDKTMEQLKFLSVDKDVSGQDKGPNTLTSINMSWMVK